MLRPPLLFAHRGARAHETENTLAAFRLAVRLGATGIESDVWMTSDGVAVLDHDGVVGPRLRRRKISDVARADLPGHIPELRDLFDLAAQHGLAVSLDAKDMGVYARFARCLPVIPAASPNGSSCAAKTSRS